MSGHSKWSTIHRQKESADQKKGQLFSKLGRAITIAAREGPDPDINFKLRLAVEKARQANMPKDNIKRAIQKGAGDGGGEKWEEVLYEGFGPGKAAVIVEAVTNNRNRTGAEIKNLFERNGGGLATPGAVSFLFKQMGFIAVKKDANVEEQVLKIIDLGPKEVEEVSDAIEIYVEFTKLDEFKKTLEANGFAVTGVELVWQPTVVLEITDRKVAEKILGFLDKLEEHDDVQRVFANFNIPDELIK